MSNTKTGRQNKLNKVQISVKFAITGSELVAAKLVCVLGVETRFHVFIFPPNYINCSDEHLSVIIFSINLS